MSTGGDPLVAVMRLAERTAGGLLLGCLMKSQTLVAPIVGHYLKNDLAVIVESVF